VAEERISSANTAEAYLDLQKKIWINNLFGSMGIRMIDVHWIQLQSGS